FLVSLGLWLNGDLDNRIRELHALQDNRMKRIRKRVARGRFLQASQSYDVTCIGFFDVFTAVGVHLQHTADALTLALDGVFQRNALLQDARVDACKGEGTNEGAVHDLGREQGDRFAGVGMTLDRSFRLGVNTIDCRNIDWRRQEVDHCIKQRLNTLVLERRTAKHREERSVDGALSDQTAKL